MRRQILAPIAAGVLLALAGTAQAATKTANFTVSASVAKNCIISAANMNLGSFEGDNNLTATSNILVRCTNLTGYSLALSAGSGAFANRTLVNGPDSLIYNLYTDGTYGTVWGDGSGATQVVPGTGAGMALAQQQTHVVHGRLLASANDSPVGPGGYIDNIVATITY